jgi:hypothetical protein
VIELGYAAGFFDGEGCVSVTRIRKRWNTRSDYHQLFASASGVDDRPIILFHESFGGRLTYMKRTEPRHRNYWRWDVCSNEALRFLETLLPRLVVKYEVSKLGIELQKTYIGYDRWHPPPPEILAYRQRIFLDMRKLTNRKVEYR